MIFQPHDQIMNSSLEEANRFVIVGGVDVLTVLQGVESEDVITNPISTGVFRRCVRYWLEHMIDSTSLLYVADALCELIHPVFNFIGASVPPGSRRTLVALKRFLSTHELNYESDVF